MTHYFPVTLILYFAAIVAVRAQVVNGPAGISRGIVFWLDASDVNNSPGSNPADSTRLPIWKDRSGNGYNARVLSGQDTPRLRSARINGKDAVQFLRSSSTRGTVYISDSTDIRANTMPDATILIIYRPAANTATERHGIWGNHDGSGADRSFIAAFNSTNGQVSVGRPASPVLVTAAGIAGTTRLLTTIYDHLQKDSSMVYMDGLPVASASDSTHPTSARATLRIGWDGDDNPFRGDIAEMVLYRRKLSLCELKTINRYFSKKYNILFTTASITPTGTFYICGSPVSLSSNAGDTYQWLRDGIPIPAAISSTYSAAVRGLYSVAVTHAGCTDTSAAITVADTTVLPAAADTIRYCQSATAAALTATKALATDTLKWYDASGKLLPAAPVPLTTMAGISVYYVSQKNKAGCESGRINISVIVRPSPAVSITPLHTLAYVFCRGDSITIKANEASAVDYQWYHNSFILPAATQDTLRTGSSADYSVIVHNIYGCTDTETVHVVENPLPAPVLSPTALTLCPGISVLLYTTPATSAYTYEWIKDGTALPPGSDRMAVSAAGTYSVKVTDNYNCVGLTNNAVVSVYPAMEKPEIIASDAVLNLKSSYATYQWYRNGKPIPGANARSFTMIFDGDYSVTVTDKNGCIISSDPYRYAGLYITQQLTHDIQLFPNPASGIVYIEAGIPLQVRVTDLSGRLLLEQQRATSIDLGPYADGLYLFTIRDSDGVLLRVDKVYKMTR